ncbi:MAG: acetylornithine deacetylase/succinyl-diaminopimelate desuccinylase-like protein [Candidatus Azotimanducaceae bacterium]
MIKLQRLSFCAILMMWSLGAESSSDDFDQLAVSLQQTDRVQTAIAHVLTLEPQSQSDLIELNEIPAPPFQEDARAERFREMLVSSGLTDVFIDEVGNVIGRRPGTVGKRTVVLSAHLDTVFPAGTDVTVRFEGDRMLAPGIGDNTRGLVTVLAVLRAMEYASLQTEADVWIVGNVGEEGLGDLRGVKHLFRQGAHPIDALIAIDGGRSSRIVFGGVGSHRYRLTFVGPGGHSWGAFGMANPHHALGRAIAIFDANGPRVAASGEKTTYNVGRIGGGTSVNSIPFESWAEIDMRSGDQSKLDEIDAVLQASVQQALREENAGRSIGPELTVDVKRVGTRPAAAGNSETPLVQKSMAATRAFNIEPELRISSTDANLPISKGIPAVTMSRGGRGGKAHSPEEWWVNDEGHIGIQITLLTLLLEAGCANCKND